jgi:Type III secretion basal body protein I, YscI, HrpB, PscI
MAEAVGRLNAVRAPDLEIVSPGMRTGAEVAACGEALVAFRDAMSTYSARPGRLLARAGTSDPLRLQALSDAISSSQGRIRELNQQAIQTRDPSVLLRVTEAMADSSLRNELVSKVVGKTISGIDQLTKLS